jgi:galactokinase
MDTNKESMNIDEVLVDRKKQVVEATEVLKNYKNINYLWELNEEDFEKLEFKIEDELLRKRAKHIITENERVKKALRALKTGNIKELGTLMVISHNSLERWYEVTGVELDTIVDEALRAEGCIGAKMIGDGFGGYAIALVNKNYLNKFFNRVKEKYTAKIGYEPNFYL